MGPKRRGMRLVLSRPSLAALALRLSMLIAPVVAVTPHCLGRAPIRPKATGTPRIYHQGT